MTLRAVSAAWFTLFVREGEKMVKKIGYSLVVAGALWFGTGVVNTVFVGSAMAEEKKCDKCGHLPAECAKANCQCDCQKGKH